ncbi:tryptophan 7-halogenase [Sphingomonas sp. BT-65]|uniref:tryptophan halogenase family protein n=1 Tax=Sphingomonas sp. BT-65 TaxID=2989821 RepID=UPI002235F4E7|nr:tryptophan halogenase family protein [Sphingomonas sp. BT-65]MCW4463366.1 tryptophan 7-halogenase [Sphingomonas sp. BT-65]
MTDPTPRNIVIAGGGTAGWMAAAALARFCGPGWRITLVESEEIGTVGVGEATIPMIRLFNQALGIDEAEFLRETHGTWKLGIEFDGWGAPGERYMHAFGVVGRGLGLLPFHPYWLRARAAGRAGPLGNYVLNAVAAKANRFAHVERAADSALPAMPYAFHFDAGLYAAYLRRYAEARGVVRTEGRIEQVERDGENGDVGALVLASGVRVAGELFVDCSGFRGLLIEGALETGFEDWGHWLPCDSALAVPCERAEPLIPYTRATARAAGWQWRIPLQHRTGNGYVFSSAHIGEDEAAATLLANLDGAPQADPRLLKFRTGKRRKAWNRNVVALGLAAGFIEPLESTSIHLIQTGITRLLDFLPAGPVTDVERDAYNRLTDFEIERIRDFVILHYFANCRHDPFWKAQRGMRLPEKLNFRIDMFRSTGRIIRDQDELFDVPGWVQVMIGQGIVPERWHPLADTLDDTQLDQFLSTVAQAYQRDTARLPGHADYLARFCGAPSTLSQSSIA